MAASILLQKGTKGSLAAKEMLGGAPVFVSWMFATRIMLAGARDGEKLEGAGIMWKSLDLIQKSV